MSCRTASRPVIDLLKLLWAMAAAAVGPGVTVAPGMATAWFGRVVLQPPFAVLAHPLQVGSVGPPEENSGRRVNFVLLFTRCFTTQLVTSGT